MSLLPKINCILKEAHVSVNENQLIINTGSFQRTWLWLDNGFSTLEITNMKSNQRWKASTSHCDWQLPDGSIPTPAKLLSLTADIQDDEGFTSKHISVIAEIDYPQSNLCIKFEIWVFPSVCGIRTQLSARINNGAIKNDPPTTQGKPRAARIECIPYGNKNDRRRFFGYYTDTQNRNDTYLDILKEETNENIATDHEVCTWASVACLENDDGGIALVKESHKCVNQNGHASGDFICSSTKLMCTGWGFYMHELNQEKFTKGWATWCLSWSGGDLERELSFKTFDRTRYPIDPTRDIYIQANTWGSTDKSSDARFAATETSVLKEIDICADIGIDVLQIDDGWQVPPGHTSWNPGNIGWNPHTESYPDGWKNVKELAAKRGVKLGIWAAAEPITLQELKNNREFAGFVQYKLDFAVLKSRAQIDDLMNKVREFIKWSNHKTRVNWDVTEIDPRYGYFFGREYGSIYLENRKTKFPTPTIYRPHTTLRDLWQISKYLTLHRFQGSIQNIDMVDKEMSDAHLHSHQYATAITLMSIPLFFAEMKYYSETAKNEIIPLLNQYKKHRNNIYKGIVHPIGSKPNNASWTGFQCHIEEERSGYLTIFRERCNKEESQTIKLGWVKNIKTTNLLDKDDNITYCSATGEITTTIKSAPGFLFLKYSIIDND